MSEHGHLSADLGHDDQFEREMRGYSRRAVDEYVAALRIDLRSLEDAKRDLEDRLSQALDENERIKHELATARSAGRPPHEEISERIGQILKLADDEAKSQRSRADEEIAKMRSDAHAETTKLRSDVKAETDKSRAEAQEQAERMLSAAQEQAETTVATAKSEAEKARKSAATDAQQVLADATKQAETAVATAKAQAKQQLDEATARATAIHDGAERRLNLLMSRHTEAIRRLTEIRDVVTTLVAGENDRGSLEDEVARSVAGAIGAADQKQGGRGAEGRHAGGQVTADAMAGPAHGPQGQGHGPQGQGQAQGQQGQAHAPQGQGQAQGLPARAPAQGQPPQGQPAQGQPAQGQRQIIPQQTQHQHPGSAQRAGGNGQSADPRLPDGARSADGDDTAIVRE
jgi:cell division septum initiation protein DivIVA